jgi:hypothetical protein
MLDWLADNWIALLALIGTVIGWWDNRRRLVAASIEFVIEPPDKYGYFPLRNIGRRAVVHPHIDPASVAAYSLVSNVGGLYLEPQESKHFRLLPDADGNYPDTVRVTFRLSLSTRVLSRVVRLPSAGTLSSRNETAT